MNLKLIFLACACTIFAGLSVGAGEEALPFLKRIKAFSDFTLEITEAELKAKIEGRGIYSDRTVDDSGSVNFWLLTEHGENINVMFRSSGECSGVQRMRPIPKEQIKEQIGEAAYEQWEADKRKLRLAKERAEQGA